MSKTAKYGELFLLWALCTVCTSATAYIYLSTVINLYSVIGAVMSAAVILFIEFIRKKKFGGVLYVAVLICIGLVPQFTITSWTEMSQFVLWFFSGSEAVETTTDFIFTLTVMMCFCFTSVAYYFTKVIYRSSIMTLITLIPFALAVKTAMTLPYAYPAIAAALNIIFFVFNARKSLLENAKARGKSTFTVYADFTGAVILLALLLPKPSVTPYYDKFEEVTNRFQIGGSNETLYTGEYKDSSGGTDELRRGESVLIYIASTADPVYMKTQVFDIYDYELGGWVEADKMMGSKKWQESAPLLSYEKLSEALESLYENGMEQTEYLQKLSGVTERESYSLIYTQNYPAVYILAPLRATGLSLSSVNTSYSARTDDGEIFTNRRLLPENAGYTVRYYTEDIFEQLVSRGLCDINSDDYDMELYKAWIYAEIEDMDEEAELIGVFFDQHIYAEDYAEKTVTEVSPEIQALADELTEGLEYDYQKAEAIERYFYNGFKYDLYFEAPEESDTPEYFLFESKTGICSDFATAYTLLARAAGLTVRYVEGFVMQPAENNSELYYIYTDTAHAYPEVYIPGAGWQIYEPTPAAITPSGNGAGGDEEDEKIDPLAAVFTAIIAVVVIGIFILMIVLAPKLAEMIFRLRVSLSDNGKAVILLYNRHSANLERKFEESCKALTPEQLGLYTENKTALSLEPLTKPFIKTCYGGIAPDDEEKKNAFDCYKAQYKAIKKTKKRKD